jgi:hypothetical protein
MKKTIGKADAQNITSNKNDAGKKLTFDEFVEKRYRQQTSNIKKTPPRGNPQDRRGNCF